MRERYHTGKRKVMAICDGMMKESRELKEVSRISLGSRFELMKLHELLTLVCE